MALAMTDILSLSTNFFKTDNNSMAQGLDERAPA
jgi:hypothetical protein